ncbi:unnamed protein product [Lymnaea stagnalis]|uniref:WD repeat-containing protein 75 second beta-propeller domain-containing protein n=1 Tax=Lymnaea stagnalis TaxID=6523 RepID=A0AAV2HXU8_LYMST
MALVPSLQAGSQFGKYIFSHDSKYIFCCCGEIIKVFNTTNGELLHDLKGHSKVVTGLAINPSNVLQMLSCGQDGLLIYWDYLDGVRLKASNQHDLHLSLYGIVSINAEKKFIMMLAQTSEHNKTFCLMLWKKKSGAEFSKPKMLIQHCDGAHQLVSFGCSKEIVASGLKHELSIHSMKNTSTKIVSDNDRFNKFKSITCVACHPTEYSIATGLENGKILVWHNFYNEGQPLTSVMHWHALSVLSLEFTPDGSNLLSGGHECVLVRWQIGNHNQCDFKPRMGSPINQIAISPDGNFYATKHNDNVIQLLDIDLKIQQVYRGLTHCNFSSMYSKSPIPSGLNYDPRSRTLVTNGLPGHLQFYSLVMNRQIFNLDIVGQNFVSADSNDQNKYRTEVLCSAISDDGEWLATFEMWDDGFFSPDLRLKFWVYSPEVQTYSLNTTVEHPHDQKIISLLFRPQPPSQQSKKNPMLITVGADFCYKMWALVDDSDIYRSNTRWNCESVGFYRGLDVGCADFSVDGSTLAVGFKHLLTLWDPDSDVVRVTLSNALAEREDILHLKFGSCKSLHHLVCATKKSLISWDLLTLTILWKVDVEISSLVRDPSTDIMAYISNKKTLCFFRPSSAQLVYTQDNISASDIQDVIFVPDGRTKNIVDLGWPGSSQIYIYNSQQQLITLDLDIQKHENQNKIHIAQNLPENSLKSMMAEKLVRDLHVEDIKETMGSTKVGDDEFIAMLLHSNEPVLMHCEKYLSRLLVKKKQKRKIDGGTSLSDKDDSSSDEESASSSGSETEPANHDTPKKRIKKAKYENTEYSYNQTPKPIHDMDKILSKSSDWVKWCASLSLK